MKKKHEKAPATLGTDRHKEQNDEVPERASFGAELRWIGHSKGLLKKEYAGVLNISLKELWELEKGLPPSPKILARINAALNAKGWTAEAADLLACADNVYHEPRKLDSLNFESMTMS